MEAQADFSVKRITLAGEYDLTRKAEIAEILASIDGQRSIVIDLSDVTYIDSTILGALAALRTRYLTRSIQLAGPNKHVERVLKVLGFDQLFEVTEQT